MTNRDRARLGLSYAPRSISCPSCVGNFHGGFCCLGYFRVLPSPLRRTTNLSYLLCTWENGQTLPEKPESLCRADTNTKQQQFSSKEPDKSLFNVQLASRAML